MNDNKDAFDLWWEWAQKPRESMLSTGHWHLPAGDGDEGIRPRRPHCGMARKPIQVFETCSCRNESDLPAIDSSSVVRGSDELRGENVPDRAWRAARSLRGLVHDTHRYLAGTA